MQNENTKKIMHELINIALIFLVMNIIFKIIFNKESMGEIIKLTSSLFWLFVLPGFFLMYFWQEELDFLERIIIGSVLGVALFGVIGYNLNLSGLRLSLHGWILPVVAIIACLLAVHYRNKKE